jgi:hypothetical protein
MLKFFIVGDLLEAKMILDTKVTLSPYESGPMIIMSSKKAHVQYTIHNPTS